MSIESVLKKDKSKVERRFYIKRMTLPSGEYESNWLEITKEVKKWGSIKTHTDSFFSNKYRLNPTKVICSNEEGKFNPSDDQSSLWYGYNDQQRTLVKIETPVIDQTLTSEGFWRQVEYPPKGYWDSDLYDVGFWEARGSVYQGIISGDLNLSSKNEVALNIAPLNQIFRDFPAENLTGFTSTGLTASQFIELLRDFTDNNGSYVFRPFFGYQTSSSWEIHTTTAIYADLNTNGSEQVEGKNVWQIIEELAEAENYVPVVKRNAVFYFGPKTDGTESVYEFHGAGSYSSEYGQNIKRIDSYGKKLSKYYSRVRVKWQKEDTITSYHTVKSDFTISASNLPWRLGFRSLDIDNQWIGSSTMAETIAQGIFDEVSAYKNEITFTAPYIPHLEVLDLITVSYDPAPKNYDEFWDLNDWNDELTWARKGNDALIFNNKEFKIKGIEWNLDKLETKIYAREA